MFGSIKDEEKKLNLKGIGLGLVISKLIVEKFSGCIDFISKLVRHKGAATSIGSWVGGARDLNVEIELVP